MRVRRDREAIAYAGVVVKQLEDNGWKNPALHKGGTFNERKIIDLLAEQSIRVQDAGKMQILLVDTIRIMQAIEIKIERMVLRDSHINAEIERQVNDKPDTRKAAR